MKPLVFIFILFFSFSFPAKAIVLYNQNFSSPDLPADWSFDYDGNWSIVDGQLDQSRLTAPGHMDAWAGDLNWSDYSVEMDFQFLEFGSHSMDAGLGLRHNTENTGGEFFTTRVSWRDSYWDLEVVKTSSPEIHIKLDQNLTLNTWYSMKSEISGDNLRVWVNNILYDFGDISSSEYPVPSAGGIGVWSNEAHVRFDNVIVKSLTDPVPEPASIFLMIIGMVGLIGFRKSKMFNF